MKSPRIFFFRKVREKVNNVNDVCDYFTELGDDDDDMNQMFC